MLVKNVEMKANVNLKQKVILNGKLNLT